MSGNKLEYSVTFLFMYLFIYVKYFYSAFLVWLYQVKAVVLCAPASTLQDQYVCLQGWKKLKIFCILQHLKAVLQNKSWKYFSFSNVDKSSNNGTIFNDWTLVPEGVKYFNFYKILHVFLPFFFLKKLGKGQNWILNL